MKKYIKIILLGVLGTLGFQSQAQFLETPKPTQEATNTPFFAKYPEKTSHERVKTRSGLSTLPLSMIASGLEVAYDQFSKNNVDTKITLGYYANKASSWYDNIDIDNSATNTLSYKGKLLDLEGFKAEIQVRKMLGTTNDGDLEYSFGFFAQIKNANARFVGSSSYGYNGWGTPTQYTRIDKSISSSALFLGPVIMGSYTFNKFMYTQLAIGTGPVIGLGGNELDRQMFDLGFRNPYQKAIGLKVNFAIGFYLD